MPFVDRDQDGRITGRYTVRQYPRQEWLNEVHADLQPPAPDQEALYARAADQRWQRETGGIDWNGLFISTLREHQASIKNARDLLQDGTLIGPINMVLGSQTVASVNAAQAAALVLAIGEHVQGCFNQQTLAIDAIAAGTITSFAEVDAYFS